MGRLDPEIAEEPLSRLEHYARISCAFTVERVLEVTGEGLRERVLERTWTKDYDAIPGNHPRDWRARFDLSRWAALAARLDGRRVGGAVLALDATSTAVLWDLRVSPALRGRGIGGRLLAEAERLARARHSRWLEIETQNVNVAACRLYVGAGYALASVDADAYPDLPGETRLVWRKEI